MHSHLETTRSACHVNFFVFYHFQGWYMLFAIKKNNKKKQRIEYKQGGVGANLACEGHRIPHTVSREGSLNQCNKKYYK